MDKKGDSEWYELYINGIYNDQGIELILWKDIRSVTCHGTHSITLKTVRMKNILLSVRSLDLRERWMTGIAQCLKAANKESAIRELTPEELKEKEKEKEINTHITAGLASYKVQEWEEAIACFTSAITLDPRRAAAYCGRCMAYIKVDRLKDGKKDALTAIDIDASYGKAHLRLAQVYCALNDFAKAEQSVELAIKLDPSGESYRVKEEIKAEKRKKSMISSSSFIST